jgi:hypothetical protein
MYTLIMAATGTRKAPIASATLFKPGTTKTGNDGNKWTIVADKRGVQRWKLKNKPTTMKQRRPGKSARVLAMEADPTTVWGKNKPLERFWDDLASGRKVVVIYANPSSSHKIVTMPTAKLANKNQYIEFDDDPNIIAVLSSNISQDAYEIHLYPKAKDKTVDYVIKNYKKFFKDWGLVETLPYMKKVMVPS